MYFRMSAPPEWPHRRCVIADRAISVAIRQRRVTRIPSRSAGHREVGRVTAGAARVFDHRRILLSCEKGRGIPITCETGREGAREYPGTTGLVKDAGRRGARDGGEAARGRRLGLRPHCPSDGEASGHPDAPLPRAARCGGGPGDAPEGEDPAEGQDDRAQEQPDVGSAVPRHIRRRHMAGDRSEGALPHGVVHSNCDANGMRNVTSLICLSASVDEDEGDRGYPEKCFRASQKTTGGCRAGAPAAHAITCRPRGGR